MFPSAATRPALTVNESQMLTSLRSIDYSDVTEFLPAFIAVAMMVLTYNIANDMALSILFYLIMRQKKFHLPCTESVPACSFT